MGLAIIAVIIGLAILVWSADTFIDGATSLAVRFNMPSFLIGVIILGIGTSAPELVVSALAALSGSPDIALGNAYGSNIINITLVLGVTALISPIIIRSDVIRYDLMLLIAVTALAAIQLADGNLSSTDGMVLIGVLVAVLMIQIFLSLRSNKDKVELPEELAAKKEVNVLKSFGTLILGLSLLIASSRTIVWGAVELATLWGMSELLIGLTIVAIGTSLPELVASVAAAKRGEHDMALGNVIGSNLFNTLGVVGLAAIIKPIQNIDPQILSRDMLMVGLVTVLLFILAVIAFRRQGEMKHGSGVVLILTFIFYSVWLAKSAM